MSRIDELIQQLCPDGVEYRCIGDFVMPEQLPKPVFGNIGKTEQFHG